MKNYLQLIIILLPLFGHTQNISVKSFDILENDLDARINFPLKDQNGDKCAIIKVVTTENGFAWEGDGLGIVAIKQKVSEYWIYVPYGVKHITIKHPKLGILRNYIYTSPIKEATVYEMKLVSVNVNTINGKLENNDIQKSSISKEIAIKTFKDIVRVEPINCIVSTIDGNEYIICLANKIGVDGKSKMFYANPNIIYYKLSKFANAWRVEEQSLVDSEEFTYFEFHDDFEIVKIGSKHYLFFIYTLSYMGNAESDLVLKFSLFSLSDLKLTSLDYSGNPTYNKQGDIQQINGVFSNLGALIGKPELSKYLEGKASKSTLIYRSTVHDLEINNADNYEKKWQIENSSVKTVWEVKENTFERPLSITYYSTSIFPKDKNYINDKIENNKYEIISLFRNNIIGYDKIKKEYFPIWVETCSHGCNKSISFINESIIQIVYSEANDETITIDLTNMTYKITL